MVCVVLFAAIFLRTACCDSQTDPVMAEDDTAYRLKVGVDEVYLTFHAADVHGLPNNDLKLDELRLLDDGKPPLRVLDFRLFNDSPVRAGILVDTSDSMQEVFPVARSIAICWNWRRRRVAGCSLVMDRRRGYTPICIRSGQIRGTGTGLSISRLS